MSNPVADSTSNSTSASSAADTGSDTSGADPPVVPSAATHPARPGAAVEQAGSTVGAGRGLVYIAAAKIYFMLVGSVIEFLLPRLVGPFLFGAYRIVAQSVSVPNNVMIMGTIQAVSRQTTADLASAQVVKATGLRMHLFIGLPVAVLYALLAPVLSLALHDASKTGPMALSAAILCGYAFYAVLVGSANGTSAFHKQAGLDITFATLRAIGIIGGAALGLGLFGMIGGWVGAVCAIIVVASLWVGLPRGARAADFRPMAAFLVWVALYLVLTNLIMWIDQFMLKRLSAEWFIAHGHVPTEAARLADGQVGYYGAVQNLARFPYQLILAATFVIFPLVSRATFEKNHERTGRYIRTTLRYSLVLAAGLGMLLVANPVPMLDLPYPPVFAQTGGPALVPLAIGYAAFALSMIAGTILNGAGRTRDALVVAIVTLLVAAVGLSCSIPLASPGWQMLLACASATAAAMVLGAFLALGLLWKRFRSSLPIASLLRICAAAAAGVVVGRLIPATAPVATMIEAAVCGLVFLVVLIASGELGREDWKAVRHAVARRK
ncbi:MAG: polysaccharide biosynthesis C-terminal domain-containing protein [Pseudomonadota bacterium]